MSDFSASIKAILDTSEIEKQINALNNKYTLDLKTGKLDTSGLESQMKSAGVSSSKEFAKGFSSLKMPTNTFENGIWKMQRALENLNFDRTSIDVVTKDLKKLDMEIGNVVTSVHDKNLRLTVSGIDEFENAVTVIKDFDINSGKISEAGRLIASTFDTSADGAKRWQSAVKDAVSEMISNQKKIGSLKVERVGLDSSDINQIAAVTAEIDRLQNHYNSLYKTFGESFSTSQLERLATAMLDANGKEAIAKAKLSDTSAIEETNNAFKKLIDIQKQLGSLNVKLIGLDSSDVSQIESVTTNIAELEKEYDSLHNKFKEQFSTSQIEKLSAALNDTNVKSDIALAKYFDTFDAQIAKDDYSELLKIQKQIGSLEIKRVKLDDSDGNQIAIITSDIEQLQDKYNDLKKNLKVPLTPGQNEALKSEVQSVGSELEMLIAKAGDTKTKLADSISGDVENKTFEAKISSLTAKYNELGLKGHTNLTTVKTDLDRLNELHNSMKSQSGDTLISTYKEFELQLSKVRNGLSIASASSKDFASNLQVMNLENKIEVWLKKNTRASAEAKAEMQGYLDTLRRLKSEGGVATNAFSKITQGVTEIDLATEAAGLKGKSFGDILKGSFKNLSKYVGVSKMLYSAFNAVKQGVKTVIALDTALVDLRKTTNATESQIREFYYSSNETAKALGVTTQEVIQSAAEWSRLGYAIKDAQTMAETSAIFASISPDMDISTATDGLVSAMKAFDIEAEDALDGIASKINAVGNTQAVDNQDIVNFITKSAAAMKEANNTLEETIALGTAATEITRDSEAVGKVYADFKNNYIG